MAKCSYCGTTILFGGKADGAYRYCNAQCQEKGALARLADQLPPGTVEESVRTIHAGRCPKCKGRGPVDVHTSYRVWSALIMTRWSSRPQICCTSCGRKSKASDALYCLLLGWWGFPWGLLITPVQLGRNLVGLATDSETTMPSDKLRTVVRTQLAISLIQTQQQAQSRVAPNAAKPIG